MLIPLIVVTLFGAVFCAVVAVFSRPKASLIETRMQDFRNRTTQQLDIPDLEVSFVQRVVKPGVNSIARGFGSILPQSMVADIQKQLEMAGNPMRVKTFLTFWVLSIVFFGGIGLMIFLTMPTDGIFQKLIPALMLALVGFVLPRSWLRGRLRTKQKAVIKSLPDTLDLITTCVEAGLGLDAALSRVAEKGEGPLALEMQHMLRDVAMGKLRREAMSELSERVGVEELTNFINSIIQAEQLGVAIAQVLRVQAEQLRTQRRQRAERLAHEAPIKMLFPLVFFVFPSFMAVILGPAAIRITQAF